MGCRRLFSAAEVSTSSLCLSGFAVGDRTVTSFLIAELTRRVLFLGVVSTLIGGSPDYCEFAVLIFY